MTKEMFIRSLAETHGISIKQAKEETNRVFGHLVTVAPTLQDGEALNITGIFKMTVTDVPARTARNPQTGEPVEVEATRKVKLTPMAQLKSAVKGE
jgi:DNA-binding protein HU-beta